MKKLLAAAALAAAIAVTPSLADAAPTQDRLDAALAILNSLTVADPAPRDGYSRTEFGSTWADTEVRADPDDPNSAVTAEKNGCSTREDILARDLESIVKRDECIVESGVLNPDPFTEKVIDFTRGVSTSGAVQIDHLVALSNAWETGAQDWTAAKRQMFANDPLNLLAVDGPTNGSKGDSDASEWLPVASFQCEYVVLQTEIKSKYSLWVTAEEKNAMQIVLDGCGAGVPVADPSTAAPSTPVSESPMPTVTTIPTTEAAVPTAESVAPKAATSASATSTTTAAQVSVDDDNRPVADTGAADCIKCGIIAVVCVAVSLGIALLVRRWARRD